MGTSKVRRGFALFADVIGSRQEAGFTRERDKRLKRASKAHMEKGWIYAPYTVTAWDEFQTLAWDLEAIPHILLHLRQSFAPWELRIGIGGGAVRGWRSKKPINEAVGGEAFERAREAIEELDEGLGLKYPRLTLFRTDDPERDALWNLVYGLNDTLLQGVTERQWETIGLALSGKNQSAIAEKLDIDPSTVSRNLARGHYWQMLETQNTLGSQARALRKPRKESSV